MIHRRGFLAGLVAALCAPAIIRTPGLLMPVKALPRTTRVWFDVNAIADRNVLLAPIEPICFAFGELHNLSLWEVSWASIETFGLPA